MKQELTSNKSTRKKKGHFAPFFVVSFLSVTLMLAIVVLVYRKSIVQVHSLKEMIMSTLYVVPFTIVQCLFEEFIFRYSVFLIDNRIRMSERIKKHTGVLVDCLVIVVVSLLFAFMHFGDASFLKSPLLFSYYFVIGVYFSILTIRYKSIVPSFSLHFFNNIYTFLLVTVGETLSMFRPLFSLEVNSNDLFFLLLNFVPLVVITEVFLKIAKIYQKI